jgi:hypothetical protein
MGRDFQAKNLELFGEVAFSLLECGWRGSRMPFSDQRTEMPVIHIWLGLYHRWIWVLAMLSTASRV